MSTETKKNQNPYTYVGGSCPRLVIYRVVQRKCYSIKPTPNKCDEQKTLNGRLKLNFDYNRNCPNVFEYPTLGSKIVAKCIYFNANPTFYEAKLLNAQF